MDISLLNSIPHARWIYGLLSLLFLILPPYWFFFQFARGIFESYDTLTLCLLSLSVGLPIAFCNLMAGFNPVFQFENAADAGPYGHLFFGFCMASFCSSFIYYIPCITLFFFRLKLSNASLIVASSEILLLLFFWSLRRSEKAKAELKNSAK